MEKFTFIKGYRRLYQIGDQGTVISFHSGVKVLRPAPQKGGYLKIVLYGYGKTETWDIHRLVGLHHVPKRKGLNILHHVDRNILNNAAKNLRWVSHRTNMIESSRKKSSRFPGVSWNKHNKRWHATIQIKRKKYFLGAFRSEVTAGVTYAAFVLNSDLI